MTGIPFYCIFEQIFLGRDGMSIVPFQSNKIDRGKNQQILLALCTKTLTKILKTRKADFSGRQLSQVTSTSYTMLPFKLTKYHI
jgi:hypothetical protein